MAPYEFPDAREPEAEERRCPCGRTFTDYVAEQIGEELLPDGGGILARLFEQMRIQSRAREVLLRYPRPNPACPYCHGSGHYHVDFKPSSEFDGISYGWDHTGWIRGTPRRLWPDQPEPTFAENYTTVPELLARHEAKQNIFTNSLLTPDGEWFSFGFRIWSSKDPELEAGFIERLSRNQDCWAVGLECHC
jgi:hypothetical protein